MSSWVSLPHSLVVQSYCTPDYPNVVRVLCGWLKSSTKWLRSMLHRRERVVHGTQCTGWISVLLFGDFGFRPFARVCFCKTTRCRPVVFLSSRFHGTQSLILGSSKIFGRFVRCCTYENIHSTTPPVRVVIWKIRLEHNIQSFSGSI